MVARALEWLDVQPEDRVLDLFCGMGNFTLPLATQAASVVGVEGVPALVEKGQQNARLNGLQNVTFYHENLKKMSQSSRGRKTASIKCCWTRREQVPQVLCSKL